MELSRYRWRKSSLSGPNNECVRVGRSDTDAALGDTKSTGDALILTKIELATFLATVKGGRFTRP